MDELAKVSVIKDPKIVVEIDWLFRNNCFASKKDFCNVHRNGILFHSLPDGDELYEFTGLIMSDLLLTRKYVQQELNRERESKSARHYRQANMFSGGSVTVRIHNNIPIAWQTAIQDACIA